MRRSAVSFLRENIEAFAIAIAMALVIRHYCVEAFRIPTGSMMPTLYGDRPPLQGDRILVDKFVYQRRDPRRWEVVVFQYPLNRAKNFIKRCVGLPGEKLAIADGDLWTSRDGGETFTIARKPPEVQEQLFFPYWPAPVDREWLLRPEHTWDTEEGWRRGEEPDAFLVDALAERSSLRFIPDVTGYPGVGVGEEVGDVRVRFRLTVHRSGRFIVVLTEHGRPHRLVLDSSESWIEVGGVEPARTPIDLRLERGESYELSFANVDDALVLSVDGERQPPVYFDTDRTQPPREKSLSISGGWRTNAIELAAVDFAGAVEHLAIDRDLHYENRNQHVAWDIPEGHFLMLGDNTGSSADSREWKVVEARLQDGTTIVWSSQEGEGLDRNPASRPRHRSGGAEVVIDPDVEGVVRRFPLEQVESWSEPIERPFVPRDHLVGRAFAVFWPIFVPPIYKGPTRIQLIR